MKNFAFILLCLALFLSAATSLAQHSSEKINAYLDRAKAHLTTDTEKRLTLVDSALTMARRQQNPALIGKCLLYRSQTLMLGFRFDEAIANADSALLFSASLPQNLKVETHITKGTCYYHQEKFSEAIEQAAIAEAAAGNDKRLLAKALQLKGKVYYYIDMLDLAREVLSEAIVLTGGKMPRMHLEMGNTLSDLELREEALDSYLRAEEGYKNSNNLLIKGFISYRVGKTYQVLGDFKKARSRYKKALEIFLETGNTYYINQAYLFLIELEIELGDYSAARRYVATFREREISLEIASRLYRMEALIFTHEYLPDSAITSYRKALRVEEKRRGSIQVEDFRIGFWGSKKNIYRNITGLFFQKYNREKSNPALKDSIFHYLGAMRNRAAEDFIKQRSNEKQPHGSTDSSYISAVNRLESIQHKLRTRFDPDERAALLKQMKEARYNLIDSRMHLVDSVTLTGRQLNYPLAEYQKLLRAWKSNSILYFIGQDSTYAMVINGHESHIESLPVSSTVLHRQLDALLKPFLNMKNPDSVTFFAHNAHALYKELVEPLEDYLKQESVIIVPDGPLQTLPFSMLLTRPAEDERYFPGDPGIISTDFLAQRYFFCYATSAYWYRHLEGTDATFNSRSMALFGAARNESPVVATASTRFADFGLWPPLIFARNELKSVKDIAPDARLFSDERATPANFFSQLGSADVLHVASHAFADTSYDAFSGLVLSPGKDNDGLVMGYELSHRLITSKLITLSACETGRGQIVLGEGVMGLPRLFLRGGAQSVLMTLWQIDDRFSSLLIPRFYNALLNDNLSAGAALAQTQRAIMKTEPKYAHPIYWAAFNIYGNAHIRPDTENFWPYILPTLLLFLAFSFWFFRHRLKQTK